VSACGRAACAPGGRRRRQRARIRVGFGVARGKARVADTYVDHHAGRGAGRAASRHPVASLGRVARGVHRRAADHPGALKAIWWALHTAARAHLRAVACTARGVALDACEVARRTVCARPCAHVGGIADPASCWLTDVARRSQAVDGAGNRGPIACLREVAGPIAARHGSHSAQSEPQARRPSPVHRSQ